MILKENKLNILIIHGYYKKIAATVNDHLNAFTNYSKHNIALFPIFLGMPNICFDLNDFDVVVVHYSLCIFLDSHISANMVDALRKFKGLKLIFIQDEYRSINHIVERLNYIDFKYLFTCVPPAEIEKVYPIKLLPNLIKINTLTGFVPENILNSKYVPFKERSLDVVYRARKVPAWLGRLGLEKWQIAEKFNKYAENYDLNCDVKFNETDRIYGKNWIRFLTSSKTALGVESGSSVFDFTGEIQTNVDEYVKHFPDASFEELEQKFFPGLDGKIFLNQISPRCFECAGLRTMMVLYEGNYSGILKPWRHYVPLKKDFSNFDEVVKAVQSEKLWKEITTNVYQEVALNPEYSFKNFVKIFDSVLEKEKHFHIKSSEQLNSAFMVKNKKAQNFSKMLYQEPFFYHRKLIYKLKMHFYIFIYKSIYFIKSTLAFIYLSIMKILPNSIKPKFRNFVMSTIQFLTKYLKLKLL